MPTPLSQQSFAVVDLETTGGSASFDRVLEVAALRVRGGVVEERFQALLDPGTAIPAFITRLTGIGPAMVRGKPPIGAVLPELARLTRGAALVAHNASFDHGFLSSAFRRAGVEWSAERVCTLRLARRLLPSLPSYTLDSLCAALQLPYVQRHRAGPDAEATAWLLERLLAAARAQGADCLADLLRLQRQPVGPRRGKGRVDEAQLASLPTGPGVYLLKDAAGQVVYVGKSVSVRQRVRHHLRPSGTAGGDAQPRLRRRLPRIAEVEGIETGSELEALLLESKLVKRYLPEANCLLRDYQSYAFVKLDRDDPYPRLVATREQPSGGALYFGPFRSARTAVSAVLFLSEQLGLRQCHGSLRPGQSACLLLELGKCLGPCVGAVSRDGYRSAAAEAERILRGEDRALLDRAAERRDRLAEELRFEAAAELRDRIRDVEQLVSVGRRLEAFADRNAAVVARGSAPGTAHVLLVRAGRLVAELSVRLPARRGQALPRLRGALRRVFADRQAPDGSRVSRDELDEMVILDRWLRTRGQGVAREVPIPPGEPEAALPPLGEALRGLASPGRRER